MGGSGEGRDLDFGVATWKSHCGQKRGHDLDLASRPGLGNGWVSLVSRPEVLRSRPWVGCLGVSRPAHTQQARDLRWQ